MRLREEDKPIRQGYEINDFAKEESWRMFRIIGELVEGFDRLSGVEPAVTIYGSARIRSGDALYQTTEELSRRLGKLGYSIITGGGPGVMEAANKGALSAGTRSVGLNIDLPEEQNANPYTTLSVTFNHFFVRKVMLAKYATAFIIMPGGIGTLDELTEILCLIQTHKMKPFPVLLYGAAYWDGFLSWLREMTLSARYIDKSDLALLVVVDEIDEAVETVHKWYKSHRIPARRAIDNSKPASRRGVPPAHENGPE